MNSFELIDDTLKALYRSDGLRQGALRINSERMSDLVDVIAKITEFAPRSGWVQTTSRVFSWSAGALDSSQLLLCAELEAPQRSLHIRQTHHGWLLTWADEEEDLSGDKLLYRVTHLAREGFGPLHYDVFWDTKAQPHSPIFARLCATGEDH